MNIRMSEKEAALFKAFVSTAKSYFEFGIGGSTAFAAEVVQGPLVAVDSDQEWIAKAKESVPASPHERTFVFVDIGPTKQWGYPTSNEHRPKFPDYHSTIHAFKDMDFDLCLVDGRFRVACFLQALKCLRSDAVIGLHDYRSRKTYHVVENFARPIAEAADMTFFVKRRGLDLAKVDAALEKYRYAAP
jgi:hypothetical protein